MLFSALLVDELLEHPGRLSLRRPGIWPVHLMEVDVIHPERFRS
jgi:hypothetical protein